MTLDLEPIKKRLEGLPEGPWYSRGADDEWSMRAQLITTEEETHAYLEDFDSEKVIALTFLQQPRFADNNQHGAISHFIANARADVPALITEVERLRSLLYLTVTTANTLADELESEIKSHYQGVGHYPIEARRLERDLDVVVQARAVLPEL